MARALLGYVGSGSEHLLGLEVVRLRRRVAELEAELVELRASHEAALDPRIDLELHSMSEPALA